MSTFQDLLTFTRGTTATHYNRFGLIDTAAIDEPRFQHDPSTLTTSTTTIDLTALTAGDSVLIDLPGTDTFPVGQDISVTDSADINRYITAVVEFSNPGSVQVTVKAINGTGSNSSWTLISNLGLLIEEQRTNLLLRSEDLAAGAWTKLGKTVINSNVTTAPDGTVTADEIVDSDSVNPSLVGQNFGTSESGKNYCYSGFYKAATRSVFVLNAQLVGQPEVNIQVDLDAGEVAAIFGSPLGYGVEHVSNGWYLVWFSLASTVAGGILRHRTWPATRDSSLTGSIYAWGLQAEEGSFPTSYIKTEGSQVTRAADSCLRALGVEFPDAGGRTYLIEFNNASINDLQGAPDIFRIDDGNTGGFPPNYIRLRQGLDDLLVRAGGAAVLDTLPLGIISGGFNKVAISESAEATIVCVNGVTKHTSGPRTLTSGLTTLRVSTASKQQTKTLNIYPRALSESELIALTAPEV